MGSALINRIHKTRCPLVNRLLNRPRLLTQLAQYGEVPATAVIAPPGYGKTALVSGFVSSMDALSIWYSVDEGDNDPASFFYYLKDAITEMTPRRRKVLPVYRQEDAMNLKLFARDFFSAVYQRLPSPFTIVFDDIHESKSQQLADVLAIAIEELPEQCRIFLIGRQALPPGLARLKVNQQIYTLGEDELRFNDEELKQLGEVYGVSTLSAEQCHDIQSMMSGWGAGLSLFLSQREKFQGGPQLRLETKQEIFDYFMNEVIRHLRDDELKVLYSTSYLPEVSTQFAETLTGTPQAGELLDTLYEKNSFIYRVSEDESAYRYHPLFKSFLMKQSERAFDKAALDKVKEKTVALLEENGMLVDAGSLISEMKDWPYLAGFIIRHAKNLVDENYIQTLAALLRQLPHEMQESNGWLLYWRAFCRQFIQPPLARDDFISAYKHFSEHKEMLGVCLSLAGIIDTYHYQRDEFAPLDAWIDKIDQLQLFKQKSLPPPIMMKVSISMFSALVHRAPHHHAFDDWITQVNQIPNQVLPPPLFSMRQIDLILHYLWQGDFAKAEMSHALLEEQIKKSNQPVNRILWHIVHCYYLWLAKGEAEQALDSANQGLKLSQEHNLHLWDISLLNQGAAAALMAHNDDVASQLLEKATQYITHCGRAHLTLYHSLRAILSSRCGEAVVALQHAKESVRYAEESGSPFAHAAANFVIAQLYVIDGNTEEAKRHIHLSREIGCRMNSVFHQFQVTLLEAKVNINNQQSVIEKIQDALALAKKNNLLPALWVRDEDLIELLTIAMANNIEVATARTFIQKRNLMPQVPPYELADWPWPVRIYTLGKFAIEINGQLLDLPSRTRPKVYALLKALIVCGGDQIREEIISEILWPDAEGDAAHQSFDTTLFRLRKLLKVENALINREGKLSLNKQICWLDIWAMEPLADRLFSLLRDHGSEQDIVEGFNDIASVYGGEFFHDEDDTLRISQLRDQQRSIWLRVLSAMADYWLQQNRHDEARDCLERLIKGNPLELQAYDKLANLLIEQGQPSQAALIRADYEKALTNTTRN